PVDQQRILAPRRLDRRRKRILEMGAEGRERVPAQRDARRHGVAAALEEEARAYGLPHRATEVDARDRPAGTGAKAAGLERDRESGASEALLEAGGDEADHARVPAF